MDRVDLARLLGATPRVAESRPTTIEAADPRDFMATFTAAVAAGGPVFIADPSWGADERRQFNALTANAGAAGGGEGWLGLPTGGSSGALRLARHDETTLSAAVQGFVRHFGVPRVSAVGVLPLHHVSGLMSWMRCVITGGEFQPWSWRDLERGSWPKIGAGEWFLSLVPTQLERLLSNAEAVERLRRFRAVFVGGGPSWPELVERGAQARLPLAFSYGSTETAAMVTALRPEEFHAGHRGSGTPLPHARVTLTTEGEIEIASAALFRGYWPAQRSGSWLSGDLGCFDSAGSLHVLGRRDALIISGGEKVNPAEVEAALRELSVFEDVAVIGVPHSRWGAVVVAAFPGGSSPIDEVFIRSRLEGRLARYKWPKHYVALARWPRNPQGKLNREQLRAEALAALGAHFG